MATGTIIPIPNVRIEQSQPASSGGTAAMSFTTNTALIVAKRDSTCLVALLDYWSSGYITVFSNGSDAPTISKSSNSRDFTITNNRSSGGISVFVISPSA